MARKVFFSFKYKDVQRAMNVRQSGVITANEKAGFIDAADFEKVKAQGDRAIQNWIDNQLHGTSVTVVLIGAETNQSRWVQYEIDKSISRGNGLLTVDISKIADFDRQTSTYCGMKVKGYPHYQWNNDDGRLNLGTWIEAAAKAAGKP
ncbi:MAG: hypothetical protein EOP04_17065 [Proteobacteria bacterium]|nr:MAG: hypothetical protein EOP04_17065 [Pseudomonadota bacterium]